MRLMVMVPEYPERRVGRPEFPHWRLDQGLERHPKLLVPRLARHVFPHLARESTARVGSLSYSESRFRLRLWFAGQSVLIRRRL